MFGNKSIHIGLIVLLAVFAQARTHYVDCNSTNPVTPFLSWDKAAAEIQAAVDVATNGSMVLVTNGVYDTGGAAEQWSSQTNRVYITRPLTVQSVNGPEVTVIDGKGVARGAWVGANCQLNGFTVTNGRAKGSGGGVWATTGCTVGNCTVNGNFATENGGGVYVGEDVTLLLCEIGENQSEKNGGGIYLDKGGKLDRCTLNGNNARGNGGGAYVSEEGELSNCVLVENRANASGGGAYLSFGGSMHNCTLNGNRATGTGGVLLNRGGVLENCIVSGNAAEVFGDNLHTRNGVVKFTCAPDGVTHGLNGCITNPPLFTDEVNGRRQLQAGSPCINAGTNVYALGSVDRIGSPRIINGVVDMGAYEVLDLPSIQITTTAGLNGSIFPKSPLVFQGRDPVFSIQPTPGFRIASIMVDGYPRPISSAYVFTNIQSAHTLSATFTPTATYYVDATQLDNSGAATNWATAKKTIQAAVDLASDNDTVRVNDGTYLLTSEITVERPIRIISQSGPSVTIVDGGDSVRCFNIQAGESLLSGFTLRNGYTLFEGGGVICLDSSVTISNCFILDNYSKKSGGGMYGGRAHHCTFAKNNNYAGYGGGMYGATAYHCAFNTNAGYWGDAGGLYGDAAHNCTFTGNHAETYGGMYRGTAYFCTFNRNSGNFGYGGMYGDTAYNCTFSNNVAFDGTVGGFRGTAYDSVFIENRCGGIGAFHGSGGGLRGTAYNCEFRSNRTSFGDDGGYGGGLVGTAYNCTLSDNKARMSGGGMNGTAYNCVFFQNMVKDDYMQVEYISDISGAAYHSRLSGRHGINGCITNNPLFIDSTNGNFRLETNSPCINAGDNRYVFTTNDLDNLPRIIGDVVDMGAYERQDVGTDVDADALPDHWEMTHFDSRHFADPSATCANGEDSLLGAYIAGFDPNDPAAAFLISILPSSIVEWSAVSGRVYSIYRSTNLLNGAFVLLQSNLTSGVFVDPLRNAAPEAFYRIDVQIDVP